jgi:uncharacterized protein YjbI with pentapeptide repeats
MLDRGGAMEERLSWREQIQKHPYIATGIIVALLVLIVFIFSAYLFDWSGTGFLNKTLWDWLQLLIIPLALAVIALVFQLANSRTERQIAKERYEQDQQIALDKQHEDLLQAYLDRLSELLLKENLSTSPSEEVRNVARVRTITVLTQLNARRIGYVFTFLREARLMSTRSSNNVVSLKDADLSAVNWSEANLSEANLSEANLSEANLSKADLSKAFLIRANLIRANLSNALFHSTDLTGADLEGADLSGAWLFAANLSNANLREANLSNANLHNANLSETNLSRGNFSEANLIGAKLIEANLVRANLQGADLTIANLRRADLREASLYKTSLRGADLRGANLRGADLTGADLSKASDLSIDDILIEDDNLSIDDLTTASIKRDVDLSEDSLIETKVTIEQLDQAKSLKGATMPDGSKHP